MFAEVSQRRQEILKARSGRKNFRTPAGVAVASSDVSGGRFGSGGALPPFPTLPKPTLSSSIMRMRL